MKSKLSETFRRQQLWQEPWLKCNKVQFSIAFATVNRSFCQFQPNILNNQKVRKKFPTTKVSLELEQRKPEYDFCSFFYFSTKPETIKAKFFFENSWNEFHISTCLQFFNRQMQLNQENSTLQKCKTAVFLPLNSKNWIIFFIFWKSSLNL